MPPVVQNVHKQKTDTLMEIVNIEQSPVSLTRKTTLNFDNVSRKSHGNIRGTIIKKDSHENPQQYFPTNRDGTCHMGIPINQYREETSILWPVKIHIESYFDKKYSESFKEMPEEPIQEIRKPPEGSFQLFHTLNFLEEGDLTDYDSHTHLPQDNTPIT